MCQKLENFERELHTISIIDIEQYMHEALNFTNHYFGMNYVLSFSMPEGYELAFGLTKDSENILYVNRPGIANDMETVYYFLHELRHAIQYKNPSLFSPVLIKSTEYVFQYDGKVFYQKNNEWKHYQLQGDEAYLLELYKASPCETDANEFALRCAERLFPDISFNELRSMWFPRYSFFKKEDSLSVYSEIIAKIE